MNDATTPPSKPEKPAKATTPPAVKKEPTVRRSKFAELYPDTSIIKLLVEKNPKKEGSKSHERFKGHFANKSGTVKEALANGVTYQDIAYELGRQFLSVTRDEAAEKVVADAAEAAATKAAEDKAAAVAAKAAAKAPKEEAAAA
jgi:hypothetical protein